MSRRIGVLGGTFDPPHIGHLCVAVEARWQLQLDVVLMVVANVPWQKVGSRSISAPGDRYALVTSAVAGLDGVEASDIELRRGGDSYTIDTVEALHAQDPDNEVFVIVGADAAAGLHTWHRHHDLAGLCTLVVVDRPGSGSVDPPAPWRSQRVAVPALDVSSSDLRHRVSLGRPVAPLVPVAVANAISGLGLYRAAA